MSRLIVKPVTGNIGAEIENIDLSADVDVSAREDLKQALWAHQVLFFHSQEIDIEQQKQVTEIFGPLQRLPYVEPIADEPFVIGVRKKASDRKVAVFGGELALRLQLS
jgi:taurine dioxygenase